MITMDIVEQFAFAAGLTQNQWQILFDDVMERWGDYPSLHLPSFMLGQIEMSTSTIQAYKEEPEMMLAALESYRYEK